MLLGQEDHAHAILAWRRQLDAAEGHFFAIELVGQLDQDAGAIAHQRVGTHRAAVIQVAQDQQTLLDDLVALAPLDVRHKTHAAGVVFVPRVIQTLRAWLIHGPLSRNKG